MKDGEIGVWKWPIACVLLVAAGYPLILIIGEADLNVFLVALSAVFWFMALLALAAALTEAVRPVAEDDLVRVLAVLAEIQARNRPDWGVDVLDQFGVCRAAGVTRDRHKVMRQLTRRGWIKSHKVGVNTHYWLTGEGAEILQARNRSSRQGTLQV